MRIPHQQAGPSKESPTLEQVADWVVSVELSDIPTSVQTKIRFQILNVMASLFAAKHHQGAQAIEQCVIDWKHSGNSTVIPRGVKLPLHEAVLVNCINSMALDYDDYLYMGHTGHSSVLASWALCEELKLNFRDLILLVAIGNEVGGRLGITTALGPQNGQAWSYIHCIAGAAITAKAYKLSAAKTTHAMSIALYQPGFTLWPGFMGADSKLLTAATPTVQGIQAAQFARAGMTGTSDVLDHPQKGFWKYFTYVSVPHMMGGLGQSWLSDTLTFKKYPGCAYIDTTMDALFEILNNYQKDTGHSLNEHDIKNIHVKANLLTMEMNNLSHEYHDEEHIKQTTVNFSLPLNIAIGIIAGRLSGAELKQSYLEQHQTRINTISQKFSLEHDWGMTLSVIEGVNDCLGQQSLTASLSLKQWFQLIRGFRSQLGGTRKHTLNLLGLWKERKALFRLIKNRPRLESQTPDLGKVDFEQFEMRFPAQVSITLNDGTILSVRKDIPLGAQAQAEYYSTVIDKYILETNMGQKQGLAMETLIGSAYTSTRSNDLTEILISNLSSLLCCDDTNKNRALNSVKAKNSLETH